MAIAPVDCCTACRQEEAGGGRESAKLGSAVAVHQGCVCMLPHSAGDVEITSYKRGSVHSEARRMHIQAHTRTL